MYNEATKAYDQDVSIDGDVVSRLSYSENTDLLHPCEYVSDVFFQNLDWRRTFIQKLNARMSIVELWALINTSIQQLPWQSLT